MLLRHRTTEDALRDYKLPQTKWPAITWQFFGMEIQTPAMECNLGLELSPHDYVAHMVFIFRLARRVLRDDGTLFLNIGDSYWSGKGATRPTDQKHPYIKSKDVIGIPWMLAFALRDDGWTLRQDIIWHKPNPMPESVIDRCTKSHEYIFMFSKNNSGALLWRHRFTREWAYERPAKEMIKNKDGKLHDAWIGHTYYFDIDAIAEPAIGTEDANGFRGGSYVHDEAYNNAEGGKRKAKGNTQRRDGGKVTKTSGNLARKNGSERGCPEDSSSNVCSSVPWEGNKRNKRDVWTVAVRPFNEAHFATFPEDLIIDCIKAGSPIDGVVLDPFAGAGTTPLVSRKLGRNFMAIDLSKTYIEDIAVPRLKKGLGLFY